MGVSSRSMASRKRNNALPNWLRATSNRSLCNVSRAQWTKEATRLRDPDKAQHGIDQLRKAGERLREEGTRAATAGESYELGETALQMAIVLLSIALVARSRKIVWGAMLLAVIGIGAAAATYAGLTLL